MSKEFKLVVKDPEGTKTAYPLKGSLVVGRKPPSDILLAGKIVSGQHARFDLADTTVTVEDLGSANGVYVNGERIDGPTDLGTGDTIQIGEYQVRLKKVEREAAGDKKERRARRARSDRSEPEDGIEVVEEAEEAPAVRPEPEPDPDPEPEPEPEPENEDEDEPRIAVAPAIRTDDDYLMVFLEPIREFLADPSVTEVMVNRFDSIYIEKKGKIEKTKAVFSNDLALKAAVENIAQAIGRRIDDTNPQLDARLPDGSRVHAVYPPCARLGICMSIRKFSRQKLTMEKLVEIGTLTPEASRFLEAVVRLEKNVIVSGGTGSGKTSLLNAVSAFIPEADRILVIEDASELRLQQEHVLSFETRMADKKGRGLVTIRDLLRSALRLRPDRIIIGEIRGGESLDLLQAMNTGHGGSMSTIHANSPMDTLSRLETCALLAGVELPHRAIRDQIASAINVVIYTARLNDGTRKVTQVSQILGLSDEGRYDVLDIFQFKRQGVSREGKVLGKLLPTGKRPTFHEEFEYAGIEVPASLYESPKK